MKKYIKKHAIRLACKTILKPKSIKEIPPNVRVFECTMKDVQPIFSSTNNVLHISTNDQNFFFRECKLHKGIKEFVQDEIEFYYTKICPNLVEDKIAIQKSLLNRSNFKKFVNMGIANDFSSGAYHFCIGDGGKHIGLEGTTLEQEERIKSFVQFIWGELYGYILNCGVKIGNYQIYNSVRSIATYRIAKMLGVGNLIPQTEYAVLHIDETVVMFGTIMQYARGECVERKSCEERKGLLSASLQRDLMNLNFLDAVCLEKDHRLGNYNVTINEGKASGIVAFDNDSPKSFSVGGIDFYTYQGCVPLVRNGKIRRPYVDRELAKSIMQLNKMTVYEQMKDILNVWQIIALNYRLDKLKKALNLVPKERCISTEEWSEETIREELNGKYGKTYLIHFIEEQQLLQMPWIAETERV